MQTDHNELYRKTAERTGKSEDKYKEIGNFVFKALNSEMARPKTLIFKLKGVGSWYLRKTRIEKTVELFPPNFDKVIEQGDEWYHKLKVIQHENKIEIYNIFKERIEDYKRYVEQKSKIRKIRNETQQELIPPETSEDND